MVNPLMKYVYRFENEFQLRQFVEADINALRKMLDDTNMARLHLENDVERLKVELIELKKQHQLVNAMMILCINIELPKTQSLLAQKV